MTARVSRGDKVKDPTSLGRDAVVIDGPSLVGGTHYYLIVTSSGEEAWYPASDLQNTAPARDSPVGWLTERSLADPDHLARAVTQLKLTSSLTDLVYSFSSTRTVFRVHQFKPVLKVIESPDHRLLLADEVGLGKTIEAGLVWSELDARLSVQRVLIVCPSGLRRKWQSEMQLRFDREMELVDRAGFLEFLDRYHDRGGATRIQGIASFAQLRHDQVLEALSERPPTFDIVIVDEAHAFRNADTRTHQLGELLAQNSDAVLFLSATPVNLGSQDLFNLLRLLRPDEFSDPLTFDYQLEPNRYINSAIRLLRSTYPPPLSEVRSTLARVLNTRVAARFRDDPRYQDIMEALRTADASSRAELVGLQRDLTALNTLAHIYTRTRKRELKDQPAIRRARTIDVSLTDSEQSLYESITRLVGELRRTANGVAPALAAIMPARQASSCLPVMRDYLKSLIQSQRVVTDLEEGEEDVEDEEEIATNLTSGAVQLAAQAEDLCELTLGVDSKFDALYAELAALRSAGGAQKILIFSFFKRTLSYLETRLRECGLDCIRMDGDTPVRERAVLMSRFRHGSDQVLLSSEIGSEGLDFEFCDTIVNYDLPWNPMRLEQRIGRLDRFGQMHPVIHVVNFSIPNTIDTEIFLRLYRRIGIFEESVGELEPILGERIRALNRELATTGLSIGEQQLLADSIALAVEAEKRDLDDFEEARERLIGADTYVEEALDSARLENRYITPEETARFVSGFLREAASPARLEPRGTDTVAQPLMGSPALADLLREHGRPWATPAFFNLITTLEAGGAVPVIFNAEESLGDAGELLSARHPLIRSIAAYYESSDSLPRGGYARIERGGQAVSSWIFFLFLLTATGVMPRRSLMAVAWNRVSGVVDTEIGTDVLRYVGGPGVPRMQARDIPVISSDEAETAYRAVLEAVDNSMAEMRLDLAKRNEALIAARRESLRQSLAVRTTRLRDMAAQMSPESPIRRMRLAQASNDEERTLSQISELERHGAVAVGFKVVAGGLVDFV